MLHDHTGRGYIWTEIVNCVNHDIPFRVDGKLKYGHVAKLATNQYGGLNIDIKDNQIHFCVEYITTTGNQCATIPDYDKNWTLFQKITNAQPVFIVFREPKGYNREMINGIGTMNFKDHINEDYDDKWLFWKVVVK
ncbi:MAG: hypothetical protein R2685_10695 [Candidatus Nitrosocosmicus sp.]|nr:hypothetical protein [Candidatus Nitrosocosmicus sp.]